MACHHGPRGGVVEVVRGCAANTAGTVVVSDVTEPPLRLKYAHDGRRPRGAPYRAPAYPGGGRGGGKHTGRAPVFPSCHPYMKEYRGVQSDLVCFILFERKQRPSRIHAQQPLLCSGKRETRRVAGEHTYPSIARGLSPPRAAIHTMHGRRASAFRMG